MYVLGMLVMMLMNTVYLLRLIFQQPVMLRKNQWLKSIHLVSFNNDGTKMFVIGYNGDYVLEYDLTTVFDISASFAGNAERFL